MGGIMMPYLSIKGQQGYVTPNTIPNLSLWYNGSASTTVQSSNKYKMNRILTWQH